MSYDEMKDLCREALKDEDYNYLYTDRSKKKSESKNCICSENKPERYTVCIPETSFLGREVQKLL